MLKVAKRMLNYSGTVASKYFTAEDGFWGNLAGCLEAIDAGTTTVLDHAHLNWSPEHSKSLRLFTPRPSDWFKASMP